ncbi:hypothetical protein NP493_47g04040 [Ridgeia piscesae]|uniref:Uncharacterized protein n=1 Tax=Ridgeia piscesae TaxID=27915 RepID=A0AAD9PBE4_RIDPI|nr:hypothetical protein NP493_47g04040 [Ridgeia piscesae]
MSPSLPVPFLDVRRHHDNVTIVQQLVPRTAVRPTEDAAQTQLDVIVVVLVVLVTALVVMVVCKLMQKKRHVAIFSGRKDNVRVISSDV